MRSTNKRVFRVERGNGESQGNLSVVSDNSAQARHDEIMGAIAELRNHIEPQEALSKNVIEACQRDLQEALKIKSELKEIHDAIARTKLEIATLHRGEHQGIEVGRMTNELDAIVNGTEQATESILQAAEQIDSNACDLVAALRKEANHNTALDIQDQVIKIFEACNFQDLTGQRITKVVKAFCFIEDRVQHMMEIWGGLESFQSLELDASSTRDADEALLNGPSLVDDEDIASQCDIDALFD
jgi:chemotaxis protein CheZ